jgi:hypothetical protein
VVNASFMMGGLLGLALLASRTAAHTDGLAAAGVDVPHRDSLSMAGKKLAGN